MHRVVVAIREYRLWHGRAQVPIEEHGAARGVDSIDSVPIRHHVYDVAVSGHPLNRLVCNQEWLRIDLVIDGNGMEKAKAGTIHIRRRKDLLMRIPPGPLRVIMVSDHIYCDISPKSRHLHNPSSRCSQWCTCDDGSDCPYKCVL